ncbi:MAG: divergent polysaccharide deacetylase family protein [Gammaproteobacteria bacterium]|nr:divergent polysaccharide deacetylase family protein [Gammaproteobacteria bacterium]
MIRSRPNLIRLLLLTGLTAVTVFGSAHAAAPSIAIIIDDLGYRYDEGQRAVALPGDVTCAVIPNTPHGADMAEAAHAAGKEIMLHLPMQPLDKQRPVGDEGIALETTRRGVTEALSSGMLAVPHVVGVNNHMGSLITRHPGHMTWLMQDLLERNLFFIDSVTTRSSVALRMAREQGVTATRRDLFLDFEEATEAEIHSRLQELYAVAYRQGHALGIGHPYPATMAVLERELPRLAERGIRLVTVSQLIEQKQKSAAKGAVSAAADYDSELAVR